ncbi:KamA family radical SAM protein [Nannocystis bainbridge]|uniref:Lysine 2,3-aminomutase n=1 Tax=Nannocystis bainbridge TaxID=2995303 RepID=A0ABT5EAG6_9BACT|nr:lysine 2,3-aminomutase [Nannocystis bainbridge]MDC0722334.1 lysine 2,3-aminomutase [Nannocystis bainbridge]
MPDGALNLGTYRAFTARDIDVIPQLRGLPEEARLRLRAVAQVLPFRVNAYVLEQLIDWSRVPDDPMYQLTIPQAEMLHEADVSALVDLLRRGDDAAVQARARTIQRAMNPHPAGQVDLNVPIEAGVEQRGLQHKYRQTVLFFPAQGQTCHAYCTYCFRWAQFVGLDDLKFATREADSLVEYLRRHPEVSDVLFTGGDPLVMRTSVLRRYVEPLLKADLPNLAHIRFGTKALAYWPARFLTDPDADDLLRLFGEIEAAGKHVAVMAHYSHPRELATPAAARALQRVREAGAVVRCQAPLIRHVNDDPDVWAELWRTQVRHGAVPYYMFVERDTGPKEYFKVPLDRALNIYQGAYRQLSGLCRSVRGPSMSATPGKILLDGVTEIDGRRYFVLRVLQGRNPEWVGRIFFAEYDPDAAWLDELRPAFGASEFFYTAELADLRLRRADLRLSVIGGSHAVTT